MDPLAIPLLVVFLGALGVALFFLTRAEKAEAEESTWRDRAERAERRLREALDLVGHYDGKVPPEEWDRFIEAGDGKD